MLTLRVVLIAKLAKLVISGIFSSTYLILALYSVFQTTLFSTTSLILVRSTGVVSNFPIFILSILLFKLLNPPGTFFNLSISNLSTLNSKLAKSTFLAIFDVSTPVALFKSAFIS